MVNVLISEYYNEDKKAVVRKLDTLYTVDFFINERLVQKNSFRTQEAAELYAEDLTEGNNPKLLNEDA
jgi:hypothetical protein